MIIKGKSRSGPAALAKHLGNAEKNERVSLVETRGTIAKDVRGALIEMDAYAAGTHCEKPLYHAAISPGPQYRLTPEQRDQAIQALEDKLGLSGHARVVVVHEKLGREHFHVVWTRIDVHWMKSVSDSHNYRKHEEVARELERLFGHERVQGAHHERGSEKRPERTPSRAELRQEERTGVTGKDVGHEVTDLFRAAKSAEEFKAALEKNGYLLAKGDRRDFVVVDRAGGIHSLARRIDGVKAAELREYMKPVVAEWLPSAAMARETQRDRAQGRESRLDGLSWEDKLAASAIDKEKKNLQAEREAKKRAFLARRLALEAAGYARADGLSSQGKAAARTNQRLMKDELKKLRPQRPRQKEDAKKEFEKGNAATVSQKSRQPARDEVTVERFKTSPRERTANEVSDEMYYRMRDLLFGHSKEPGRSSTPKSTLFERMTGRVRNVEMTDRKARLADRSANQNEQDRDPDRQRPAPGGGRTRSR